MADVDEDEDFSQNKIGNTMQDIPHFAMSISEVGMVLKQYIARKQETDTNFQANSMLLNVLQYSERFSNFRNAEAVESVREALIGKYALHDCEFSCIANLVPETAEEARTLHSTLKDLPDEKVQAMLDDIAKLKKYE